MAEYRVPTTTKVEGMISTHAALLAQHGITGGLAASRPAAGTADKYYFSTDTGVWARDNGSSWDEVSGLSQATIEALIADDSNLSVEAQAVIAVGPADVDANLSAEAQAAISASHSNAQDHSNADDHPAPTFDGGTDEVVFQI